MTVNRALAVYALLVALSAAWALTRPRPHVYAVPVFCDLPIPPPQAPSGAHRID